MSERKSDRRVLRTRQLLRNALTALILEKSYEAITVQEITDRANLGRATFYLHYPGGKDELLASSLEEMFDGLVKRLDSITHEDFLSDSNTLSLMVFQHAAENHELYRVFLSGQGAVTMTRQIRDYLARVIQKQFRQHKDDTLALEILATYMTGALVTLIGWWLENNMPHSAEYMSQVFSRLNSQGIAPLVKNTGNSET